MLLPKPQVMKMTTFGTCKPRMAQVDGEQETERRKPSIAYIPEKNVVGWSGMVMWGVTPFWLLQTNDGRPLVARRWVAEVLSGNWFL